MKPLPKVLGFLLALGFAAAASALTYVDLLADDPKLPAADRLSRAEERVERLTLKAAEINRADAEITRLIVQEGKPLEAALAGKVAEFKAALNSDTVRTAMGESGMTGLRKACDQQQRAGARLRALGSAAAQAAATYQREVNAAPMGQEGSAGALEAAIDNVQASLESALQQADPATLRAQLKDLGESFGFAYGAYSTLRLVAAQAQAATAPLVEIADKLDRAASAVEPSIREFAAERDGTRAVLNELVNDGELDDTESRRARAALSRLGKIRLGEIKNLPDSATPANARWWRDHWRPLVKKTSDEVYAAWGPLREAAKGCEDADDPPKQFADDRVAAQAAVTQAASAIEAAGDGRLAALEKERTGLAKAIGLWQKVADDALSKASTVWRQMEAEPEGSARRAELYAQHTRIMDKRKEATRALEQVPNAQAAVQAELEVLKRRLPGVRAFVRDLRNVFSNEES